MTTNQTPQARDFALLAEVTTLTVNRALSALKANNPVEAATALRDALGMADRLVTTNAAALVANARQANAFHGYSLNEPYGDIQPEAKKQGDTFANYSLNDPMGN